VHVLLLLARLLLSSFAQQGRSRWSLIRRGSRQITRRLARQRHHRAGSEQASKFASQDQAGRAAAAAGLENS